MAETVLLVEDDASLRRLTERVLAKLGYDVVAAPGAESALAMGRDLRNPIDLLITDVFMPAIGGAELAQKLSVLRPGLKVLYISGSSETHIERAIAPGANFLQKPFTTDEFSKKIREILDRA
jgi:two-component system, cell cycle sensor histidine kinase and response regulator CckA